MNILVCISKTPETTAKIGFTEDQKQFISDGVNFIMNPYDEWYALVRGIELKEQLGGKVTIILVGEQDADTIIRKGLAIGADEAVRVNKQPESSADVSEQIANYAKDQGFDLILLGKETIDYNGSEVGAMLAERLDSPFISYASKLEKEDDQWVIGRDIEGGVETVTVSGSIVVSAAKGLAEQRIPNMRGIMMAKSKPLQVVEPVSHTPHVLVSKFEKPPSKAGVKMIEAEEMDELVRLLHTEAKVL